jgi:Secretion system C-terminal sorting domain
MKKKFNQLLIVAFILTLTNLKAQCIADSDSPQWSSVPNTSDIAGTFAYGTTSVTGTVGITNGGATTFANAQGGLDVATLSKAAAGTLMVTFSSPISKPTATQSFKIFGIGTSETQIVTATTASGTTVYPTFVFNASNNVAVSGTNNNEIAGSALGLSGNAEFSFSVPILTLKIEPKTGVTIGFININFLKICTNQCVASTLGQWNPRPANSATTGTVTFPNTSAKGTITVTNGGVTTFSNGPSPVANTATFNKSASGSATITFDPIIAKSSVGESFKLISIGSTEGQMVTALNVLGTTIYPKWATTTNATISGTNNNEITGTTSNGASEFSFDEPITSLTIEPKAGVVATSGVTTVFQTVCSASSLPVELVFFKAKWVNNVVKLTWQTASESNNKGFEIERSVDTKTWENIGGVKGKGNSNVLVDYSFEDKGPLSILTYYRLKQVDFDGKESYSKVVNVTLNKKGDKFSVFPNPVNSKSATISLDDDMLDGVLIITNSIGSIVKKEKINSKTFNLDLNNLSNGLYIFEVQKDQNRTFQKVLIF